MKYYRIGEDKLTFLKHAVEALEKVVKEEEVHFISGYLEGRLPFIKRDLESAEEIPDETWPPFDLPVCDVCGFNVDLVGHSVECPLHESQVSNG